MMLPILALLAAAAPVATPAAAADPIARRVAHLLAATPVIDGHNDLPWEIRARYGRDLARIDLGRDTASLPHAADAVPLMTDIPRLRAGHVGAQFWSAYVPATLSGAEAVRTTIEQIDLIHRMVAAYPRDFAEARTAEDIERIERSGRIAALIGVEGGHQIDMSFAVLRAYRALGVSYLTLTHSRNTEFADSATDAPRAHGLTPFGVALVAEMNRIGMLVDLSHVSPDTMRAALAASAAPVIFSHSGARALDDHPRDVPDDVLALLRAQGGVVMINFYPPFVSEARFGWNADQAAERARAAARFVGQPKRAAAALAAWEAAHPRPAVTVAMVADHVEHVARLCGHGCVGIGSDFDGIEEVPDGLRDVSAYPALFAELARRGWSDADLRALAGGNILRVLRAAAAVSARLQKERPPGSADLARPAAGQ
ncbi:dipeptidase [Sphingomonas morindae]|uniref:Dipeptidase n=1 Tax=Sphingomonas morindae TaxID=1541170 RepID=A0ABY4X8J7_9SPHN|nr:dipeptidase [Sphingomonas morindae]USI73252.1 dipeptidase [Sphingomonas morindae]